MHRPQKRISLSRHRAKLLLMNRWAIVTTGWICVIFFSSTTAAANWCERAFNFLFAISFSYLHGGASSYSVIHFLAEKAFHVTLFLVLAILLWKVLPNAPWKIAAILFAGLIIGSGSEFLQRFFPGRDPALRDVLINFGGTAIGAVVSLRFQGSSAQRS